MGHEVVVVGGGFAGTTAAMFAARYGRSTVCVESRVAGGELLSVTRIEDYPGLPGGVAGYDICPGVQEQAMDAGVEFRSGEAESIAATADGWLVSTAAGEIPARTVVIATGATAKKLYVPGEDGLVGHGISHCASCDGPLYRGASVAVIGGGTYALQEALELAEHVHLVLLFTRDSALTGQATYRRRVLESEKIAVHVGTAVEEILGNETVTGIRVAEAAGETRTCEVRAVFPYVGSVPATAFVADLLALDADGRIRTDTLMRTELPGILAAGDVRAESVRHAVAAAGDGATAAVAADRFLRDGTWAPAQAAAVAAAT
jgi:thioredoxin reductase (NADPH)